MDSAGGTCARVATSNFSQAGRPHAAFPDLRGHCEAPESGTGDEVLRQHT